MRALRAPVLAGMFGDALIAGTLTGKPVALDGTAAYRVPLWKSGASMTRLGSPIFWIGAASASVFAFTFLVVTGVFDPNPNWDALVGIGTIALALVTVLAIQVTRQIETDRRKEREDLRRKEAGYMALVFDHELFIVRGLAVGLIREVRKNWMKDIDTAFAAVVEAPPRFQIPLLLKFASRANRFDSETAAKVLVVLSRILQAKLNKRPLQHEVIPTKLARRICRHSVSQAVTILIEIHDARAALAKHLPPGVKIGKPGRRHARRASNASSA